MKVTIIINEGPRAQRPMAVRARHLEAGQAIPAEAGQQPVSVVRRDESGGDVRRIGRVRRGGAGAPEVRIIINQGRGRGRRGGPKASFCGLPAARAAADSASGAVAADTATGEAQSL